MCFLKCQYLISPHRSAPADWCGVDGALQRGIERKLHWIAVIDVVLALAARPTLALRDYDGVTRLDRFIWFNCGLDLGYVAVGITLVWCGWKLARSRGLVGAGLGVGIQGAALLLLDVRLAALLTQAR